MDWAQVITILLNTDYVIMAAILTVDKMHNVYLHLWKERSVEKTGDELETGGIERKVDRGRKNKNPCKSFIHFCTEKDTSLFSFSELITSV